MKIKKIQINIKNLRDIFDDVKDTVRKIEKGEKLKSVKEPELYFTSFEALRKALTPKRLELLHIIKTDKPASINELSRIVKRDIKNVASDISYLEQIGLIEKTDDRRKKIPIVPYDKIAFEIAV